MVQIIIRKNKSGIITLCGCAVVTESVSFTVRKYRKGSQDANLVGKFSRISLRSVRKKSARNFLRLGHVTGFNQPETVDETFNSLEKR